MNGEGQEGGGRPTELDQVWGLRPEYYKIFIADYGQALGRLDPVLVELCRVRIAELVESGFDLSLRYAPAVAAGLTEEKIASLSDYPTSGLFSERERVCLEFTEQFVIQSSGISDEDCSRVQTVTSPEEFMYLCKALSVMDQSRGRTRRSGSRRPRRHRPRCRSSRSSRTSSSTAGKDRRMATTPRGLQVRDPAHARGGGRLDHQHCLRRDGRPREHRLRLVQGGDHRLHPLRRDHLREERRPVQRHQPRPHPHRRRIEERVRPDGRDRGAQHPRPRLGQPEDIAAAVAYLASDDDAFVTGTIIDVDGGMLCHAPYMSDILAAHGEGQAFGTS